MNDLIQSVSDATFESNVIESKIPVLVDFWASWCGPCRMTAPILEEVALFYQGRLVVVKVNVDDNRQAPAKLGVGGIPTLILFKDRAAVARKVGAMTKSQIMSFVEVHL